MAKKPVNTADVMNSPEMKRAMKGADSVLKGAASYRAKGTVTGNSNIQTGGRSTISPSAGIRPIKSNVVQDTMAVARGAGYLADRGKKRAAGVDNVIDEAANTGKKKK